MRSLGQPFNEPTAHQLDADENDDLVRIVTQLTSQIERFDAMISNQRLLLQEHASRQAAPDREQRGQ